MSEKAKDNCPVCGAVVEFEFGDKTAECGSCSFELTIEEYRFKRNI